jgi:alkylation response protein AidB-like acyl-CoA dehydrogenase
MTALSTATHVAPAAAADQVGISVGQLLDKVREITPIIQEHADTAERQRRLPAPVLNALSSAGLLRLFVPRSLGGLEADPVTVARVVEAVAAVDSATAWSLQSANVSVWWASWLPEAGVDAIYGGDGSRMMAGAFHPPQQAVEVTGGYRVTGRAPLASMIHDCEWIMCSAMIMDNGQPRMTEHGPAMIAFALRTSEVQIIDTWYSLGMHGTDSNDVAIQDVLVPSHMAYPLIPGSPRGTRFSGPLYRFPAMPIVALFGACVLLATGRGAINELRELAQRKTPFGGMKTLRDRGVVQSTLAESDAQLRAARAFFYETMGEAWERTVAGEPATLQQRGDLLLAGVHAAQTAAKVTERIQELAGTTGMYTRSRIDRYFRDAHTLRHHGFVSPTRLEAVGQIQLGLEPEFPLVLF